MQVKIIMTINYKVLPFELIIFLMIINLTFLERSQRWKFQDSHIALAAVYTVGSGEDRFYVWYIAAMNFTAVVYISN